MKEMDHSEEDYAEMTEELWVRNKKKIIKKLTQKNSELSGYREKLLADRKVLEQEVEVLEQDNFSVLRQTKDLEMQQLEKNSEMQKLKAGLQIAKKKLVKPMTEESGYFSEIGFLNSEKDKLYRQQDRYAEKLNSNMSALGSTIMEIEFIKGEICTLIEKVNMIEEGLPDIMSEVDDLDEKVRWASKSLRALYEKMKQVEKEAKILYYEKE